MVIRWITPPGEELLRKLVIGPMAVLRKAVAVGHHHHHHLLQSLCTNSKHGLRLHKPRILRWNPKFWEST